MKIKTSVQTVDGDNIIYHIIQKQIIEAHDMDNPPDNVKYLIEQLLLWGGIWFRPETYREIPILLPYVIRDASCRKINASTGNHTWGHSNAKGFLMDDNSLIKGIPRALFINGTFSVLNGTKLNNANGYVASHIWRVLQNKRSVLASQWERTNSFIPNLVWLPSQLSKLTDREGSYAQRFVQHISGLLYRSYSLPNTMLSEIWDELKDPGITPVCDIDLGQLNYFEHNLMWVNRKKNDLYNELQSILNIIAGGSPIVKRIKTSHYIPTLGVVSHLLSSMDHKYLVDWIKANMPIIGAPTPIVRVRTAPSPKTVSSTSIKKIGKVSRLYKINGTGSYSMCQVIEEYIKFKLRSGIPFNSIYRIGQKFISNHPTGVSIASYKGAKPYSFNFKGRAYYVTTQLRDNKPTDNFRKFRTTVSKNEPAFIITP